MANCHECFYHNTGFCYKFQEPITDGDNEKCFVPSSLLDAENEPVLTSSGCINFKVYRCEVKNPLGGFDQYVYHVFVNEEFTRVYNSLLELDRYFQFITRTTSDAWNTFKGGST